MKHICDSIWIFLDCECAVSAVVMWSSRLVRLFHSRHLTHCPTTRERRSLDVGGEGEEDIEIKGRLKSWSRSLGVLFQHAVLLLSIGGVLLFRLVPVSPSLDAVDVLAASLRGDLRYRLRVQLWVLLLYDLPLRVLHDVGVVLAAVGEGCLLELVAAVGVGEEEDLGHVHRVDRLAKVLLALHLQPRQLGTRKMW